MKQKKDSLRFFQYDVRLIMFLVSFMILFMSLGLHFLSMLHTYSILGILIATPIAIVLIIISLSLFYCILFTSGHIVFSVSNPYIEIYKKSLVPNFMRLPKIQPYNEYKKFLIQDIKDKTIRIRWHKNTRTYHLHLMLQIYDEKQNKWEDEMALFEHQQTPWVIVDWIKLKTGASIDIHMSRNLRKRYVGDL